jgi:hypothetical protein
MKAACSVFFTTKKLFFYSFILLMSHCKDTYDNTGVTVQVPPFTETGANTFGCLVNGQAWANFGEVWRQALLGGNLVPNKATGVQTVDSGVFVLSISARLTVSKNGVTTRQEMMTMNIPGAELNMAGIHQLTAVNGLFKYYKTFPGATYSSLARSPFIVNVLKDSVIYGPGNADTIIVSGKFNGLLYNDAQTDSLRIVGGVFDVKL